VQRFARFHPATRRSCFARGRSFDSCQSATTGSTTTTEIVCVECGVTSVDGRDWRTFIVDEHEGQTATYCPSCAVREFDDEEADD
jgi:hypothetical protein